ncbi:hypothetical protein KUA23_01800 [Pseudomonas pergaminensis]|uniref:Uncharacterized protein n=1 Tax=Pseudomonas pergaminensis TaxID=2853159 RepID=A0ABD7TIJ9_9PSED|nr:hypothetical protein [Pseudomonas pergaminensis]USW01515.1 hypothetical protein KUA23_01800 [Pseudomonas pergaminensis]
MMREHGWCEGESYAHIFTCTYKHMQSSGQLAEGAVEIFFETGRKPWKLRLGDLMKFLTEDFYSKGGLARWRGFAPRWGIR